VGDGEYCCSAAARWLPRILAASLLAAGLLAAFHFERRPNVPYASQFEAFLVLVGGVLAFWVVKAGAEVRLRLRFEDGRLWFSYGGRSAALELRDIERFEYAAPFVAGRRWLAAAQIIDRGGAVWRVPALLANGGEWLDELLRRTGRSDLDAWAEALNLRERMSRAGRHLAIGYGVALGLIAVATVFYIV
jgi:hypothetical protein